MLCIDLLDMDMILYRGGLSWKITFQINLVDIEIRDLEKYMKEWKIQNYIQQEDSNSKISCVKVE